MEKLSQEGIETRTNPLAPTALTVIAGERKIRNSSSYLEGDIELQDASSQAVVAAIPHGARVLDYCAGGGGKALAIAMDSDTAVFAHDIDPARMRDLPARATRAGVTVHHLDAENMTAQTPFDVVLCDAPCSGSGAWRRSAEGKWTLSEQRLKGLTQIQDDILDKAAKLTANMGTLVYATCSVFSAENERRITAFLTRHPEWAQVYSKRFDIDENGDGFFTSHLMRV